LEDKYSERSKKSFLDEVIGPQECEQNVGENREVSNAQIEQSEEDSSKLEGHITLEDNIFSKKIDSLEIACNYLKRKEAPKVIDYSWLSQKLS
jgi:hypothetical protein